MYTAVRAAAISFKPKQWDKAGNAARMEELFVAAAKEQAQVIVTTEGALEGYVVNEVIAHPELAGDMLAIAEPLDGPNVQRFQRLAQTLNVCLCFGFAERVGDDVYNCAIFLNQTGRICGRHHKAQLAEGYHPSWSFNRLGDSLRSFETPWGRAGIVICNERWNPDISRALVLDGAQVLYIPSAGRRDRAQNLAVLARARENGVPIVEANVGVNLIISKGEIVAYKWGNDQITTATIEIPAPPSSDAAGQAEANFMRWRATEMERRYEETMANAGKAESRRRETTCPLSPMTSAICSTASKVAVNFSSS